MRIGVRMSPTTASGVLVDRDRVLASASVPVGPGTGESIAELLHDLGAAAPCGVTGVTWDVASVLEESLTRAARDREERERQAEPGGPGERAHAARDATPAGHRSHEPLAQRVAALRVVPRLPSAPTMGGHPAALIRSLVAWRGTVAGGHDLFGNELAPLDLDGAERCAATARATGLTTLAVTATGASALASHEQRLAARLLERFPDLRLCLSYEAGGLGLLEREATTIVNAALLDVAERLVTGCERATRTLSARASCSFATGDGGRVSGKRLRWFPAVGLAATGAAALIGAATLSGTTDALVVLTGPSTLTLGQVREGLPHVESDLPGRIGVRTAAPQPVLTVDRVRTASEAATLLTEHSRRTTDVVAVLDEGGLEVAEQVLRATGGVPVLLRPGADIAAVGAACTEPSAWLDLLVPGTAHELDRLQSRAEQQALTLVAANGARPGSEHIVRSAATAVGYLRSSLYRLQVRASSRPATEAGTGSAKGGAR